jgi:hypothetical protein
MLLISYRLTTLLKEDLVIALQNLEKKRGEGQGFSRVQSALVLSLSVCFTIDRSPPMRRFLHARHAPACGGRRKLLLARPEASLRHLKPSQVVAIFLFPSQLDTGNLTVPIKFAITIAS